MLFPRCRGDAKDQRRKERGELMAGGSTPTAGAGAKPTFSGGAARMRTASAVKEAYGRPRHSQQRWAGGAARRGAGRGGLTDAWVLSGSGSAGNGMEKD